MALNLVRSAPPAISVTCFFASLRSAGLCRYARAEIVIFFTPLRPALDSCSFTRGVYQLFKHNDWRYYCLHYQHLYRVCGFALCGMSRYIDQPFVIYSLFLCPRWWSSFLYGKRVLFILIMRRGREYTRADRRAVLVGASLSTGRRRTYCWHWHGIAKAA